MPVTWTYWGLVGFELCRDYIGSIFPCSLLTTIQWKNINVPVWAASPPAPLPRASQLPTCQKGNLRLKPWAPNMGP